MNRPGGFSHAAQNGQADPFVEDLKQGSPGGTMRLDGERFDQSQSTDAKLGEAPLGEAPFGEARVIGLSLSTGSDPASVRARVEAMEMLLERSIRVPGTNVPIGLDALLGLIPILGDIITTALGAYIVWEARNLKMSKWHLTRMGANVAFDTLLGAVPLVGDAADFLFRSNTRNLRIIKKYLDKHHPETHVIEG